MDAQQKWVKQQIDRVDAVLPKLATALEQSKADFGCLGWSAGNELAHIATQLEAVYAFWTQTGPEYEED